MTKKLSASRFIIELAWSCLAWLLSRAPVRDIVVRRAYRTPYTHISIGRDLYMKRWWVFNPYGKDANGNHTPPRWPRLPSIRVHWIRRPDVDRHLHDHPWNARTIVLRGWYIEERQVSAVPNGVRWFPLWCGEILRAGFLRDRGYTGRLLFGEYHRIVEVPPAGVWTLFFTWKFCGDWGYLVDGQKVPHAQYERDLEGERRASEQQEVA